MKQTIAIVLLLLGLIAVAVFAFFQTRNLEDLQASSTEALSALQATATQASNIAIASETAWANAAYATYTQAANEIEEAAATRTEARVELEFALATSTQAANEAIESGTENAQSAFATGTALAESSDATGTAQADISNSTSTQAAAIFASEAALGTESASSLNNQYAVATSASNQQATLQAQNLTLSGTVEASGWLGNGLTGESAVLPDGFELFEADSFEIALPESFQGAALNENPRSFFRTLDRLGLESTSEYLEAQDENFLFFAIDTNTINELPRATVSLLRDIPAFESSLSDYLGGAYVGSSALLISDILPINGQAAGRSIVQQSFENSLVRQMQYVFEWQGAFYILTFSTPIEEFAALRPTFEASAVSLRLRD